MTDQENQDWEKIARVLFQKKEDKPGDYFVDAVMAKLEPGPKQSIFSWLVPSLGFGVAVLFLFSTFLPGNEDLSMSDLMISNGQTYTFDQLLDYPTGE